MEMLQQNAAQMESLLSSLSPEMRQELEDLSQALLEDDALQQEMAEIMADLLAMSPTGELGQTYSFSGYSPARSPE